MNRLRNAWRAFVEQHSQANVPEDYVPTSPCRWKRLKHWLRKGTRRGTGLKMGDKTTGETK